MRRACWYGAIVAALLALPSRASAERGWDFLVEAGTTFPLALEGRATVLMPLGLFAQGSVGWLPAPYVDVINSAAVSLGAYDSPTADLIRESLDDSLVVGARLGWDPGELGGFWFAGAYTVATLGAGVSARSLVETTIGVTIPPSIPDLQIGLTSSLHLLGGAVGWTFVFGSGVLTAEVSVQAPVGSSAEIDTRASGPAVTAVQGAVDRFFDRAYDGLVLPAVGIHGGFRF